jgi:flagellar hook-associated protein FlgK
VAEQLAKLSQSTTGADAIYHTMIVGLGSEVQFAQQQSEVQSSVVGRLDDDRKAVSGVNLDEEMVNLVAAQQARLTISSKLLRQSKIVGSEKVRG